MKIKTTASLGECVGMFWRDLQSEVTSKKDSFHVASPLSSTPLPIYEWIIANWQDFDGWEKVRFVLMDEQVESNSPPFNYIPGEDSASYEAFANEHLLLPLKNKLGFPIPVVKPKIDDIDSFYLESPIDLLVLALGVKGNFANVMPNTTKSTSWHIAHLIPEFQVAHTQAGSESYEGARFREFGMSLGPREVVESMQVVVAISGEKKRSLTRELFSYQRFDPSFPLSIIHEPEVRDRVTVFLSEELGDLCSKKP